MRLGEPTFNVEVLQYGAINSSQRPIVNWPESLEIGLRMTGYISSSIVATQLAFLQGLCAGKNPAKSDPSSAGRSCAARDHAPAAPRLRAGRRASKRERERERARLFVWIARTGSRLKSGRGAVIAM